MSMPTSLPAAKHSFAGARGAGRRRGRLGVAAIVLSVVACYGTLALITGLSAFGIALAPDETLLKTVIAAFALLAAMAVVAGRRRRGSALPVVLATAGAALLVYLLFVRFDRTVEVLAFVLLALAVFIDWRGRVRARCAVREHGDD